MKTISCLIMLLSLAADAAKLRGISLRAPMVSNPASFPQVGAGGTAFPLKVASNGRYLVDQNNSPVLIIGDAPHNLFEDYSLADAYQYMTNRASNGINTIWVEAFVGAYTSSQGFGNPYNPFLSTVSSGIWDLTATNPPYWQQAATIVSMAATQHIQVLFDTLETGQYEATAAINGSNRCHTYGQMLGNTFKNYTNIIWITGNDYQDWAIASNDVPIKHIALGIKDVDPNHLHTTELNYTVSMSTDDTNWNGILNLNSVYSYYVAYDETLLAWNTNPMPVLFLEGPYEAEAIAGGVGGTQKNLRRTEYWSLLNGALAGYMYGHRDIWRPQDGWQTNLNTLGTTNLGYFRGFFTNLAWYSLVPDQSHALLSAGYGTRSTGVFNENSDYAVAALTTNRTLGVVYSPTNHTLTIQMTNFSGSVTSRWFDPTAGTFSTVTGSPFANTGSQSLATPGNNSAGEGDWVLLLESAP